MGPVVSIVYIFLQLLCHFPCHGQEKVEGKHTSPCPTIVVASETPIQPLSSALTTNILMGKIPKNYSKSSPFERELNLHELLEPLATGTNRFNPHCSIILIHLEVAEVAIKMVEHLMDEKLVRVNVDLFIFNGRNQVLWDLPNIAKFDYITFKHVRQYEGEPWEPLIASQGLSQLEMKSESYSLNGKHLKIKALNTPWFKVSHEDINKYSSGCYYLALKEASRRLNFSYTISEMTEGTGRKNGSKWIGSIGDLLYRRMDIVLTIAAADSRNSAIDGSDLLFWLRKVFWVRIYHEKQRTSSIIEPLSPLVWLTILIALTTFVGAFYVFILAEGNSSQVKKPKSGQFSKALDAIVRGLLEQAITFRIQSSRTRYILFLWMIYTNVMLTGYRSKLFDVLGFASEETIPRTFKELAFVHSDYKIVYRSYGGVAEAQLEHSTHPMHRAIQRRGRFKYLYTSAECMKAIAIEKTERRHGCIDFDVFGQFSIASNLSITRGDVSGFFKESQDTDGSYIGVWAFRKRSGLTRIFNQKLARMLQADLIGHWFREDLASRRAESMRYFKNNNRDGLRDTMERLADTLLSTVKPMPLKVFIISFIILAAGHMLCLLLFGLELAWAKREASVRLEGAIENVIIPTDCSTEECSPQLAISSALHDFVNPTALLSATINLESSLLSESQL